MQINKINEFVITAENSQRKTSQQINNSAQKILILFQSLMLQSVLT